AQALALLGRRDEAVTLTLVHGLRFRHCMLLDPNEISEERPQTLVALLAVGRGAVPHLVETLERERSAGAPGAAPVLPPLDAPPRSSPRWTRCPIPPSPPFAGPSRMRTCRRSAGRPSPFTGAPATTPRPAPC